MKRFLPLLTLTFLACCTAVVSADWRPLWPGVAPGMPDIADPPKPEYQVHLPEKSQRNGAAMVIFPGGGYGRLALDHEGREYAEWLNQRGIAAVIVKYRVSGDDAAASYFPIPLLDARRAIRTTRAMADEWDVDPSKVGVMGSSAGGHLASMCATMWDIPLEGETTDAIDAIECRPDFAVLIYPVIAISEPWGHTGSQRRLTGPDADPEQIRRLSTHLRVTENTPPCFLIHSADDRVVPARNSLEFAARCDEHGVPVVCHIFASGGHGYGLKGKGDSQAWPALLEGWLENRLAP